MPKPHHSDKRCAPLGDPPSYFDEARSKVWSEIEEMCPLDLKRADRLVVEILAKLILRERNSEKLSAADHSTIRQLLAELDMTPKSRGEGGNRIESEGGKEKKTEMKEPVGTFHRFKTPPRPNG